MLMTSASLIRFSPSRCFFPNAPWPTMQIFITFSLKRYIRAKFNETRPELVIKCRVSNYGICELKENCRMIGNKGPALWAFVIALALSFSASGAGQGRRNQQQGPSALDQL